MTLCNIDLGMGQFSPPVFNSRQQTHYGSLLVPGDPLQLITRNSYVDGRRGKESSTVQQLTNYLTTVDLDCHLSVQFLIDPLNT